MAAVSHPPPPPSFTCARARPWPAPALLRRLPFARCPADSPAGFPTAPAAGRGGPQVTACDKANLVKEGHSVYYFFHAVHSPSIPIPTRTFCVHTGLGSGDDHNVWNVCFQSPTRDKRHVLSDPKLGASRLSLINHLNVEMGKLML